MIRVVPAYGRDYASKRAIEDDWRAGKNFILTDISHPYDGKPVNREDARRAGETQVQVRYGRLRRVCVIDVDAGGGS